MSMRSVRSLELRVGIVGIPLKVYKSVDEPGKGIEFRQVHAACNTPINRPSVCRACDREISAAEIRKAYELSPSEFIEITPDELKALRPERDGQITVETYLPAEDLDLSYLEGTMYLLSPNSKDTAAFCTFRDALAGRYCIAKVVLYDRERVVAIRANGRILTLHYLRTKAEVRALADVPGYDTIPLFSRPEHVALMGRLMEAQAEVPFEEVVITKDRYVVAVQRLIASKVAGLPPDTTVPDDDDEASAPSTNELLAALEASLAARDVA